MDMKLVRLRCTGLLVRAPAQGQFFVVSVLDLLKGIGKLKVQRREQETERAGMHRSLSSLTVKTVLFKGCLGTEHKRILKSRHDQTHAWFANHEIIMLGRIGSGMKINSFCLFKSETFGEEKISA